MKTYKKLMNALAGLEKLVLEIATVLILVLTVGMYFHEKSFISPGHLPRNWLLPFSY